MAMWRRPWRVLALGASVIVTVGLMALPVPADPPAASAPGSSRPADYVVVFWYARSDPLTSMRHQTYDVRQGQYTPAVRQWVDSVATKYPAYAAYVREVRIDPQSSAREKKQLATVILQEYVEKGGSNGGYGVRDAGGLYGGADVRRMLSSGEIVARPGPRPEPGAGAYLRGYGFLAAPGANRPPAFLLSPSPATPAPMPFPYPYVRPRP
jgi:hypothetical protein